MPGHAPVPDAGGRRRGPQHLEAQVYALVRRGDLPAIKIGGRGQWRVEAEQLEAYIDRMYDETRAFVDAHPFTEGRTPKRRRPPDD